MKRKIDQALLEWKKDPDHYPLLLRGARQIGKTYSVRQLGKTYFKDYFELNFEKNPEFKEIFNTLDPKTIINRIETQFQRKIQPGKSLLFFDEIQECPSAIMALRYFKEEMQTQHVIGAGSLLEFALHSPDFRMPVGRVQFLYQYPLSFYEFLQALDKGLLLDRLDAASFESPPDNILHEECLKLLRVYFAIGGMPAAVASYKKNGNFLTCQNIQSNLLLAYRQDFGKYSKYTEHKYLELLFEKAPRFIAEWFKYSKVDPHTQSRTLKNALEKLSDAGLIHLVHATGASGLPLIGTMNERKFKLLFVDIGLAHRACRIDAESLLKDDLMLINKGALAEQFVGQELLANSLPNEDMRLFFWHRDKGSSCAEVDYVIPFNSNIIPIEVKAGATGRLRSLQMFIKEKGAPFGLRVSSTPLKKDGQILSIPFYLMHRLQELIS